MPVLDEIRRLDPERDHQRIVFLSTRVDFPFDTTRALELALFRTFGVPSISALLHRTGEFERRAQKRYDDTDIIVSEMMEHGYDSERGRAALARMNGIHGRFKIANEDFLYVLSTFVFEPIRFNARFGWRRMIEAERLALFHFWRAIGERMGIKDIPADYATFERFTVDYEARRYKFTEANHAVGSATRGALRGLVPASAAPAGAPGDLRAARRYDAPRVRISGAESADQRAGHRGDEGAGHRVALLPAPSPPVPPDGDDASDVSEGLRDRDARPLSGAAVSPPGAAIPADTELAVDAFEKCRVAIQGFHDCQPDRADIAERLLSRGFTAGGILLKVAGELLEAFIAPAPVGLGLPAVVSHLTPQLAQLFQDQSDAWIDVPPVLSVGHGHKVTTLTCVVNVSSRIRSIVRR